MEKQEVPVVIPKVVDVVIPATVDIPANASLVRDIPASIDPTTTAEEDRRTHSQRQINKTWELTQSFVASIVTVTAMVLCIILSLKGEVNSALLLVSNAFFLIIGFYFSRTNHEKTGGVTNPYQGR